MTIAKIVDSAAGVVGTVTSGISWLPWAVAGVMGIAGAGGTLWYRMQWVECEASVARDANKAQEQLRLQQEADAKFRNNLQEQLAPILQGIRDQNQNVQVALAKVKSDPNCAATPAARAFDSIVQPGTTRQNGPGPKRPSGPGPN